MYAIFYFCYLFLTTVNTNNSFEVEVIPPRTVAAI
jgi:hypothetical protein